MKVFLNYLLFYLLYQIKIIQSKFENEVNKGYAIFIDAGSIGTRVYIYSYNQLYPLESLIKIYSKRNEIALSSLVNKSNEVILLLEELVNIAKLEIPKEKWIETEISLMATAGLRQLPIESQEWLIFETRNYLQGIGFKFYPGDTRVIDGKEEAFLGWLAVVVAFRTHQRLSHENTNISFGALDMGGASKQIAFNLKNYNPQNDSNDNCKPDWSIQLSDNEPLQFVISRSISGFGLRSAMDEIISIHNVSVLLNESLEHDTLLSSLNENIVETEIIINQDGTIDTTRSLNFQNNHIAIHPCLAVGEFLSGSIHDYDYIMRGEGNFTKCLNLIRSTLLPRVEKEIKIECIHKNHPNVFIAMDSFPKMMNMLGLLDNPSGISPQHILENGIRVCQISWEDLLNLVEPTLPAYHSQRACFASAYIYFLLTDVYGLRNDEIGKFIPMFEYNDHDLTWVLGAVAASILPPTKIVSINNINI